MGYLLFRYSQSKTLSVLKSEYFFFLLRFVIHSQRWHVFYRIYRYTTKISNKIPDVMPTRQKYQPLVCPHQPGSPLSDQTLRWRKAYPLRPYPIAVRGVRTVHTLTHWYHLNAFWKLKQRDSKETVTRYLLATAFETTGKGLLRTVYMRTSF